MSGHRNPVSMVIATDPHKASWTARGRPALQPVADDPSPGQPRRLPRGLRRFASRWPNTIWAIEGATGLGAALTPGSPPTGSPSSTYPRSSPPVSGCSPPATAASTTRPTPSVGIAARTATRFNTAAADGAIAALRRSSSTATTWSRPAPKPSTASTSCSPTSPRPVRAVTSPLSGPPNSFGIRPRDAAGKTLRTLAADLVTEVRQLDRRITKAAADIQAAITESEDTRPALLYPGKAGIRRRGRRGGRVVEGTPLLRAQASKGPRGFESHPLRQPQRAAAKCCECRGVH